jgi:3-carboxy-cis,cis-muconate cycloisomerase
MQPNGTTIDSSIYCDIFSTSGMREVWSDQTRIQRYLDVEKALSVAQGRLGVIPSEAADEIARHCNVAEMDFEKLKSATEHIGYPVLPVVQQLTTVCKSGLGQWCHWGATTQDITDTATVLQIRSALLLIERDLKADLLIIQHMQTTRVKLRLDVLVKALNLTSNETITPAPQW